MKVSSATSELEYEDEIMFVIRRIIAAANLDWLVDM
jgi:hypothetical protein